MGLLAECQFCRQFFSARYMDEHIRKEHGIKTARVKPILDLRMSAVPTTPRRKGSSNIPRPNSTVPLQSKKATVSSESRVARAALEQQSRRVLQGQKNKATATYVEGAKLKTLNSVPLGSIWKEQVTKLLSISPKNRAENDYSLHLQSVPARTRNDSVRTRKVKTAKTQAPKNGTNSPAFTATMPCSCGGSNPNCYRCFGNGYHNVSMAEVARAARRAGRNPFLQSTGPVRLGSDPGGAPGLREEGRFSSSPDHDDHGDDSGN